MNSAVPDDALTAAEPRTREVLGVSVPPRFGLKAGQIKSGQYIVTQRNL